MAKISEETKIGEMMKKHPETVKVLKGYKLDCFGCSGSEKESLKIVSVTYGIDLKNLLKDLNNSISG